jgi:hypothetical protein
LGIRERSGTAHTGYQPIGLVDRPSADEGPSFRIEQPNELLLFCQSTDGADVN